MARNIVTFDYSGDRMSFATKLVLGLCKLGLIKLSDGYLPIVTGDGEVEIGGLYEVIGIKPLVDFISWFTDYRMAKKYKYNLWNVDFMPDGTMMATKV